ncbi:hypothetical protein GGI26_004733 [Coemansia sp. RSA 1358]|nr:hypothetical protein GGI26_004733 [Coemansia sp. RSA 1358]
MDNQRPRIGTGSTWINLRRGSQNRRDARHEDEEDYSSATDDARRSIQSSYAELMRVYGRLGSRPPPHNMAVFGSQGLDDALDENSSNNEDEDNFVGGYHGQRDDDDEDGDGDEHASTDHSADSSDSDNNSEDDDDDDDSEDGSEDDHDHSQRYGRQTDISDEDMVDSHSSNESDGQGDNEMYVEYDDNYEYIVNAGGIGASFEDLPSLLANASRHTHTHELPKQSRRRANRSKSQFIPAYLENTAYGILHRRSAHSNGQYASRGAGVNGASAGNALAIPGGGADKSEPSMPGISPDIFFKALVEDTWPHYCTPAPAMPESLASLQLGGYGLGLPEQASQIHSSAESRGIQALARGQRLQRAQQGTAPNNIPGRPYPSVSLASAASTRSRVRVKKSEVLRLPLEWSTSREKRNMSVGSDHVSIRYTGPGLQDQDAAMILTDVCIPARAGVYYFEMLIKSRGQSGYIGIGLSLAGLPSNRLPGWDVGSWGYHGDDGHIFGGDGRGTSYGPRFTTGDTVGCGIDFMRQQLFFTRNGFFLGYAFGKIDTSKDLYPCVGMRTPGEHASANFGRQPFVYDISNYVETVHEDALNMVSSASLEPLLPVESSKSGKSSQSEQTELLQTPGLLKLRNERQDVALNSGAIGWSDATLGLVLSYLIQSELYAAARALIKNAIGLCSASDELDSKKDNTQLTAVLEKLHKLDSQRNARKQICKYITEGEIDHALGLLQISYPRVLEDESLVFQLRCRQFIELVRAANGCHIVDCVPSDSSQLSSPSLYAARENGGISNSSGGAQNDMMDVDDTKSPSVLSLAAITNAPNMPQRHARFGQLGSLRNMKPEQLVRVMLEYGRQLQADYGSSPNPIIREGLVHTFSLLAYADPAQSPIAALLDPGACEPLAHLVEMAIAASEKAPRTTSLESIAQQTGAVLNELSARRNGAASLISLESDFLQVSDAKSINADDASTPARAAASASTAAPDAAE